MHVVFVNFAPFGGNSGIHIHPLANAIQEMGHRATVYVPPKEGESPTNVDFFVDKPLYAVRTYDDDSRLSHSGDLIFVSWTPRGHVQEKTLSLAAAYRAPYTVHLEDNEEAIVCANLKLTPQRLKQLSVTELDALVPRWLTHPVRYKSYLDTAAGVTCITDTLEQFVPKPVPVLTFWPACEEAIFNLSISPDVDIRKQMGIPAESKVIFYPGNAHAANRDEIRQLYLAVKRLAETGRDIFLLRAGSDIVPLFENEKSEFRNVIELGEIAPKDMAKYLSVSNFLVQPGVPNTFNDFRFPSKLAMFLASGRPVVTSTSNIGARLTDFNNCLHTTLGSAEELAHKLNLLISHPEFSENLGKNGRAFAQEHFNWKRTAGEVVRFYSTLIKRFQRDLQ